MRLDVNNLNNFYSNTGLGSIVKDVISSLLVDTCRSNKDKNIVGYGFLYLWQELLVEIPRD